MEIDGVPQNIEHFGIESVSQDVPVTLGIVIDTSGSMIQKNKWVSALAAAEQFVESMRSGDEFFLMKFDQEADLLQDFTGDVDRMHDALRKWSSTRDQPTSRTRLLMYWTNTSVASTTRKHWSSSVAYSADHERQFRAT